MCLDQDKHRGTTRKRLAEAAGINAVYLSQIVGGRRTGSARTLAALAAALGVTVDALIPEPVSERTE